MFTKIIGTGSFLPKNIRSNKDLEKIIDTSDEWIITRTGIKTRHIADINDTVSSMGSYAAKQALIMADIDFNKIDMIITATTSSSHAFPSSACQIQLNLNINNSISFDIAAACTGFIYGLSIADNYIKNGLVNYALVIGSDILSKTVNINDREAIVLFGDGAGAAVLCKSDTPGIISANLHADSKYGHLLSLPYYNYDFRIVPTLKMSGNEVFKIAVNKMVNLVNETLHINKINLHNIDWFIPHQANLRMITAISKKLNIEMDKIIITVDKHGNTSAASIPLALDEAIRDGRIKLDDLILLKAFGGGFTWGSILLKF
ncbi:MAG: ketoacyl-ACP synthase III [Candidatus Lightella neohaematopini]|nr:ketoacyl-ACP synthase III [Candidatus Lightella neohaematopini]